MVEKKIGVLNKTKLFFHFLMRYSTFPHASLKFSRKQGFYVTYLCKENKSIKLQTLAWKVQLSHLLLQCMIEFEMNENQHKSPE